MKGFVLVFTHDPGFGGMGKASEFLLQSLKGVVPYQDIRLTTPGRPARVQGRISLAALRYAALLFLRYARALAKRPALVYLPVSQNGLPLLRDVFIVGLALFTGRPVLLHLHGSMLARRIAHGSLRDILLRVLLRRCAWIVLSPGVAELLFAAGVDKSSVRVVRNPAPDRTIRAEAHRPRGTWTVGFLGALAKVKGADIAVATVVGLRAEGWEVRGLLAGPIVDLGGDIDAAIQLLGQVEQSELDKVFWAEVDVLVVPSRWEEGQPFVVLEALQKGVPVVAAPSAGMSDLIDERAVMAVRPVAATNYVSALSVMLKRYDEMRAMQEQAWQRVRPAFARPTVTALLVEAVRANAIPMDRA